MATTGSNRFKRPKSSVPGGSNSNSQTHLVCADRFADTFERQLPDKAGRSVFKAKDRAPYTYHRCSEAKASTYYKPKLS